MGVLGKGEKEPFSKGFSLPSPSRRRHFNILMLGLLLLGLSRIWSVRIIMAATMRHTRATGPVQKRAPVKEIDRESASASKRFIRNLVWVLLVCGLFMGGQLLRYKSNLEQLELIEQETDKLYMSVLGPDIGESPFGRLQFEHGKLTATHRIGLDPLNVLAALSGPAVESLRVEGLTIDGKQCRVRGFFGPSVDRFDEYITALSEDDQYFFSLEKREDVFGGITFSLIVERQ